MICTNCKRQFDEKQNIPRLLVVCGHSLCQSCCHRQYINNRVQCPDCHSSTFIDSISSLPKNLALISKQAGRDLCKKHHKKYEAFCQKQNSLICIECILQDGHKNHDMDSINNSYQKNLLSWQKRIQKLQKNRDKLSEVLEQSQKNQQEYAQNFESVKENISAFFKQIKDAIEREQEVNLSKVKQAFQQQNLKFEQKIKNSASTIEICQLLYQKMTIFSQLTQIQFLESYARREDEYNSVTLQNEDAIKSTALSFTKKTVVDNLTKSFQSLLLQKSQKKVSAFSSSNYNSINQMKKSLEVTPVIKALRKIPLSSPQTPASQNTNAQNSQNKKKATNKKDLSTPTSQNQACIVINKITPSPKERLQLRNENLACQIKGDISVVDHRQSLCHSFLSNMTSFLSERKSIYVIGGFNEQANSIVKLNLFNMEWQQVCSLNSNRSKFGSIALDKQLIIFGGKKGKERVNDSQIYNLASNKWSRFTQMNKNRSGFAVVALGDILYFIGGNDGDSILNTVQTYNMTTSEWKRKDSMIEARDQLAAVVGKNNRIYAIGGFGGKDNQPLKSVEVFDPKTEKWKLLPPMHEARRALAAAVLADGIYAIGGFDGSNYMNSVQKYDEGDKKWSCISGMKVARCTHSAVSIFESQQIYVFGGFDYVPLDSVQKYNVITKEWQQITKMPTPRFMHSCVLLKED